MNKKKESNKINIFDITTCFICWKCGAKLTNMKDLEEHFRKEHPEVKLE